MTSKKNMEIKVRRIIMIISIIITKSSPLRKEKWVWDVWLEANEQPYYTTIKIPFTVGIFHLFMAHLWGMYMYSTNLILGYITAAF